MHTAGVGGKGRPQGDDKAVRRDEGREPGLGFARNDLELSIEVGHRSLCKADRGLAQILARITVTPVQGPNLKTRPVFQRLENHRSRLRNP